MDKSKNCAETPGGTHGEDLAGAGVPPVVAGEAAEGALPVADAQAAREAHVREAGGLVIGGVTGDGVLRAGYMEIAVRPGLQPLDIVGPFVPYSDLGGKAEGVSTVAHARVPEAPPFGRGVEQPEARLAHNQEVARSSRASATTDTPCDLGAASLGTASPGAADAGPDTAQSADPSADLPPWPWPCSPRAVPAPRGLFPHQRFG